MIKIDGRSGHIEYEGSGASLFAELSCLTREFVKKGIIDEKDFEMLKETVFMSDEELEEETLKSIEHIADMFNKIFGNNKDNTTEELKEAIKKEWEK